MNAPESRHAVDLPIEGMTCAACAARIEKQLNKLPGVSAGVNFASKRARVDFDAGAVSAPQLVATIEKAGFKVPPRTLVAGVPGKVLRELTEQEMAWKHEGTQLYQRLAQRCRSTMHEVMPLATDSRERRRLSKEDMGPRVMPLTACHLAASLSI